MKFDIANEDMLSSDTPEKGSSEKENSLNHEFSLFENKSKTVITFKLLINSILNIFFRFQLPLKNMRIYYIFKANMRTSRKNILPNTLMVKVGRKS
jgi:hypothetical protein